MYPGIPHLSVEWSGTVTSSHLAAKLNCTQALMIHPKAYAIHRHHYSEASSAK